METVVHMDSYAVARSVARGRILLAVERIVCTLEQPVSNLSVEQQVFDIKEGNKLL
jgi:hypothetical protein